MIAGLNILTRKNHTKEIFSVLLAVASFFAVFDRVYAGDIEPQQVKVRFIIDDGNRDGAKITIEKDGKTWKSKEGLAQQTFQLEYGHEFIFTFTKPGYITKRIVFSTVVPKGMLKDGFEPYLLDLYLYKQYDGINIVVFTQPVAKIVYQPDLDDFGYDTDYNKIVLSEQKQEEEKIKQIKETEKSTGVPAKTVNSSASSSTETVNGKNTEADPGKEEMTTQRQSEGDPGKGEPVSKNSNEDQLKNNKNIAGVTEQDKRAALAGQTAVDQRGKLAGQTGVDNRGSITAVTENDQRNNGSLASLTEAEKRKRLAAQTEAENKNKNGAGNGKVTRDEQSIDEGNRKITQVTLIQNGQVTIYKKIVYKWGVFYFQDGISITEAAFNSEAM